MGPGVQYETPGTQVSPLRHSLGITALDAENNAAGVVQGGSGGPINTPNIEIDLGLFIKK